MDVSAPVATERAKFSHIPGCEVCEMRAHPHIAF
jgi:hypothetical protein